MRPWSDYNTVLVVSCPTDFYGAADKPAIISQQNSSLGSAQKTDVLTSSSGPQRRYVSVEVSGHVSCTVRAHYAFSL